MPATGSPEHPEQSRFLIPGSELLNLDRFTLSLWVIPDRLGGRFGFVTKRNASMGSPFVLGRLGKRLSFEVTDNHGQWSFNFINPPVLKAGFWQRIVVVKEEGKGVKLFCDGKLVGHLESAGKLRPTILRSSSAGKPGVATPLTAANPPGSVGESAT